MYLTGANFYNSRYTFKYKSDKVQTVTFDFRFNRNGALFLDGSLIYHDTKLEGTWTNCEYMEGTWQNCEYVGGSWYHDAIFTHSMTAKTYDVTIVVYSTTDKCYG